MATCVIRVPEGEERENGIDEIYEKIMSNPNVMKDIKTQIQAAHSTPRRINTKRTTPQYITAKALKTKDEEKIFQGNQKNKITYWL